MAPMGGLPPAGTSAFKYRAVTGANERSPRLAAAARLARAADAKRRQIDETVVLRTKNLTADA